MRTLLFVALATLCLTGVAGAYDYSADFTPNWDAAANPGGVWSYGVYMAGSYSNWTLYPGQFTDSFIGLKAWIMGGPDNWGHCNVHTRNDVFTNPTWLPGVGMSWRENQTAIMTPWIETVGMPGGRFTAPAAGDYPVAITFENRVPTAAPTGVFVLVNDVEVFNGIVTGFTEFAPPVPENLANYLATIPLAAGDAVTFGVYTLSGQLGGHNVGVTAMIIPEPLTLSLLGMGALGLLRRRR